MRKNLRPFSEPKYEINLESKDKVVIRQQKRRYIRDFIISILSVSLVVVATLFLAGFLFNKTSSLLMPTEVLFAPAHNIGDTPLSIAELHNINIYLDGKNRPVRKRIVNGQISFALKKRGAHILGFENTNSRADSVTYAKEKALLDSLGWFSRKNRREQSLHGFVFHKIIANQDLEQARFLTFINRRPRLENPLFIFTGSNQTSVLFEEAVAGHTIINGETLARNFQGALYNHLLEFCPNVDLFPGARLAELANSHTIQTPATSRINWYSDYNRETRLAYADHASDLSRGAVFILPYLHDSDGLPVASIILAFADLERFSFEPIEIRNVPLDANLSLNVSGAMSVYTIIQAYLGIYSSYVATGSVGSASLDAFIEMVNSMFPHVDAITRNGYAVVRTKNPPSQTPVQAPNVSIVYTLDEFFARIEGLQCLALYNELASFWTDDPYHVQAVSQFNTQEREVVRGIIKWSLALKENQHQCAENNWPTDQQRLALFATIKQVIDKTSGLAWLREDVLYGLLTTEINTR